MKILLSVVFFLLLHICIYSQSMDDIIFTFSNDKCAKIESANENEWRYTRYVLSKIEPSFYELERSIQENDTISRPWFDKIFTRSDGQNYSLDFKKIKIEAAKNNLSNIPDVKGFTFIGMHVSLLENAQSITHLQLNNCSEVVKSRFREQVRQAKQSYEVLSAWSSDDDNMIMMKNKGPDVFSEFIVAELGDNPYLVRLKGAFNIADVSANK